MEASRVAHNRGLIAFVSDTSNMPQNDIGDSAGLHTVFVQ